MVDHNINCGDHVTGPDLEEVFEGGGGVSPEGR